MPRPLLFAVITALFFFSGAAGLVYQVLWMRQLGLFFGSDMYGVAIILGSFMGGLALGSFVGGRWSERSPRPLLWYGVAELCIGGFALGFPSLLAAFDPLLSSAYGGRGYQSARVALAAAALLVPTGLMGATLPLIMKHFVREREALGRLSAHFYSINTFGALAGTLVTGFVLLPSLGVWRTTFCAVAVNLGIGIVCVGLGLQARLPDAPSGVDPAALDPLPGLTPQVRRRVALAALVALGVSGFASFALEVVWTRILLISFSATVYSFASMLACFLFGIFLGSRLVAPIVDRHPNPLGLFAGLELGVGVSVATLCVVLLVVPDIFGQLLMEIAALMGDGRDGALVVSTLVASFLLLVVPTTLLGATFSVALRAYTMNVGRVGSRTGDLYAVNTVGAILGSLGAGLLLLPTLGAPGSLALVAALFTAVGLGLASAQPGGVPTVVSRRVAWGACAVVSIFAGGSLAAPYRVTLNFNQNPGRIGAPVYHAEGVQNTIDVVRSEAGITALIIGGNVEADDGYLQRRHFVLKGHLPLMLMEEPKSVLVVGLGMGITLQATGRHPGIARIDVVELSPEILEAQEHLVASNGGIVRDPRVNVRIDDGRLFMNLSRERYDMITADPIHPKISRVGYLYTREYYESIRARLNPDGVVCQWMPIYQIAPDRLRSAIATFVDVFPHATLWYVENHLLLLAKLDSAQIDYPLLARRFGSEAVRSDLASIEIASPEALMSHLLMGPDEIRRYLDAGEPVTLNTDDFPYLEYQVPGDLFYTVLQNTRELAPFAAAPSRYARGLPPDGAARVDRRAEANAAELVEGDG